MSPDPAESNPSHAVPEVSLESTPTNISDTAAAASPESPAQSLLDSVVGTPSRGRAKISSRLDQFLRARRVGTALEEWFGRPVADQDKEQIARRLNQAIAYIDKLLSDQLNAILHHPLFQRLEASWRGLQYLVDQRAECGDPAVKIKVLNVSWRELERDFERAVEFDQSMLFRKVYEQEFGMPGGEPYGVLIADYEIHPSPSADHPHNDLAVVRSLAKVGAAAFCPVIANASPAMFGMDSFNALEHRIDHARTHGQKTFIPWRSLRDEEDARFFGLAMPRVLMRLPHEDDGKRLDQFCFREDVSGRDSSKYLWGGAAFALGEVLIRSFAQAGWLADIRGLQRDQERGGLVTKLPVHCFSTDKMGVVPKMSTDVIITEELEKQLSDLGFLPLCHCKDTEYSVFYSSQSIQKPKKYDRPVATVNAQISSMLQYMLCVSRFAHYVKVIGREKVGSFSEGRELESYLQRWIVKYVTADSAASPEVKARHPLRDAQLRVHSLPGRPGTYQCTMQLAPHYELDEVNATVKLVAELTPGKTTV